MNSTATLAPTKLSLLAALQRVWCDIEHLNGLDPNRFSPDEHLDHYLELDLLQHEALNLECAIQALIAAKETSANA